MIYVNFKISLDVIRAYFIPDQDISWPCSTQTGCTMEEARSICEYENAELASITSEKEIEELKLILQAHTQHFWIGLEKVYFSFNTILMLKFKNSIK